MAVTLEELERFHGFAVQKIDAGETDLSLHDLLDEWEQQDSDPHRKQDDLLAVRAALRDFKSGDRGMPFDEHLQALVTEFGLEPVPLSVPMKS